MRKTWLKRASVMCMAALLAATGVLASGCSAKKQDEQVVIYSCLLYTSDAADD